MRWTFTLALSFFRRLKPLLLSMGLLLTLAQGQAQTLPASQGLVADSMELALL